MRHIFRIQQRAALVAVWSFLVMGPAAFSAPLGIGELPLPIMIAHRGNGSMFPEHTMEAYRASVAEGCPMIETDCFLLKDGTLGIMHDDTLDRTTTTHGRTADLNRREWAKLRVDGRKLLGGNWGVYAAPTFDEVVKEFANKVIIFAEAKNRDAGKAIVAVLKQYRVRSDFAVVNSFLADELIAARQAGYKTHLSLDWEDPGLLNPDLSLRKNSYIAVGAWFKEAYVKQLVASGAHVWAYTVNRQGERDRLLKLGVEGMYSDDSIYLAGTGYQRTDDPYASQRPFHGQLPTRKGKLGIFSPPDKWGVDQSGEDAYSGCLQGWCSPLNQGQPYASLSLRFKVTFGPARQGNSWVGVLLAPDDRPLEDDASPQNGVMGLHFVARQDGLLRIDRYLGGKPSEVASSSASHPITSGQTVEFEIGWRDGQLQFQRLDTGDQIMIKAPKFAEHYVTFGARGLKADFSQVSVHVQ